MTDPINPDHYKRLPAEAIDIIEAAIANAPSNEDAFLHGQVLKYVLRCWDKNGIEDLEKAKWYLDRLIGSFDTDSDLVVEESSKKEKWKPKIGDWVKINKPTVTEHGVFGWRKEMDKYDGAIVQVNQLFLSAIVIDKLGFEFSWLEPAEAPKATTETTLNSDNIPEGYRKLGDSSKEPRQLGDLRWSVAEKRYIPIRGDVLGYANRENWAACRKITGEVTGEATGEAKPPDGWRFLERGEVIRKGDQGFENGLWCSIEPTMIGMTLQLHWRPILRRNKFGVGEKVVECVNNRIGVVQREIGDRKYVAEYEIEMLDTKRARYFFPHHLAPYIEEAK